MTMRIVDFTDYADLKFRGNVHKNAICFGDVDNDGLNELVVGNIDGDLSIFKGLRRKALWTGHHLGFISAVTVGNALNKGHKVLVAVTGCGSIYIYDVNETNPGEILQPYHVQTIPPNAKCVLVADLMGNGVCEVVVGMTDRVVRTYRWSYSEVYDGDKPIGKLIGLRKWEMAEQIGNVVLHHAPGGRDTLLVAQPGGSCFSLWIEPTSGNEASAHEDVGETAIKHHPLASARLRHPNRATEVCGSIRNGQGEMMYAVATLDGTIILVQEDTIKYNLHVDHQIFALFPLDVTDDGVDEVVACAWDGHTYIINQNGDCVRFTFQQPIRTFVAGHYGLSGSQVPCLAYNTFENRISLYHHIHITHFVNPNLTKLLQEDEQYRELVTRIGIDVNNFDALRKLNHFLLYEYHPDRGHKPSPSVIKSILGNGAIKSTEGATCATAGAAYSEAAYSEPAYSETAYSEPAYSEPAYSEPVSAKPTYSEPMYSDFASAEPTSAESSSVESQSTAVFTGDLSPRMGTPAVGSPGVGSPSIRDPLTASPSVDSSSAGTLSHRSSTVGSPSTESSAFGSTSAESSAFGSTSAESSAVGSLSIGSLSIGSPRVGYKSVWCEGDYDQPTASTHISAKSGTYLTSNSEDSCEVSEDNLSVYDIDVEDCIYDTSSENTIETSDEFGPLGHIGPLSPLSPLGPNVGYVNVDDASVNEGNNDGTNPDDATSEDMTSSDSSSDDSTSDDSSAGGGVGEGQGVTSPEVSSGSSESPNGDFPVLSNYIHDVGGEEGYLHTSSDVGGGSSSEETTG